MRPFTLFLTLLAGATAQAQQPLTEGQSPTSDPTLRSSIWFEQATARLRAEEYAFRSSGDSCSAWTAPNRTQDLRSRLTPGGLEIAPRTPGTEGSEPWSLSIQTRGFGRGEAVAGLANAALLTTGGRGELDHGPLTEWFVNRPDGIEQGWTLEERPDGSGPLWIEVAVGGGFGFELDDDALGGVLSRNDVALPYRGLVAFDADGRDLDTWLEAVPGGFRIGVLDTDASYPIVVDPVLSGPAWTAESNQVDAKLGFALASIGDVNGDGYDDMAVGAHLYDAGHNNEGRVWVFYGGSSGLSTGSDWYAESNQAGAMYGRAIAGAGDVNGDGYDDLIVGAPLYDSGQTDEGAVWAYYGSSVGLPTGSSWFADGDQSQAHFGWSLASAGDVNGDGRDDIVVGAPQYDLGETNEGLVRVYHGSTSGLPFTASWFKTSDQLFARLGDAVASAGDVNGDGYDDILIAAPSFDGPELNEGRVWRFNGSSSGLPSGSSGIYDKNQAGAGFGTTIAGAGDVNGDGLADILIGAPFYEAGEVNEGRAWLYHGGAAGSSWFGQSNQAGALYGLGLAGVGDVNGDGYDDVLVAAPEFDGPSVDEGRVWLHLGSPPGLIGSAAWFGEGNQSGALFGRSLAGLGDVDGDGFDDVAIGAPGYDAGQSDEGRAYVYTGSAKLGSNFCLALANSTGQAALISATNSPSVSVGKLTLQAGPVPNGFGIFFHGSNQMQFPFGDGFLCVTGPIVRGAVISSQNNVSTYTYDNSSHQHTLQSFIGTTRYFQAWYRDPAAGGSGFNLSNGIAVTIAP